MHGTAKAEGSGPKKRRRWGDGILVGLQGVARGRWGTFATDWPMRERGRTPLHTTDRSSLRPSPMALLLAAVTFFLMVVVAWAPAAHAIPFQLRGGTISRTITVGHAVDSVLLEDVLITDGMPVVFDVAAMLPGALQINLKDCVCEGGSQIYVLGYKGEPSKDQTLEVNVSGLDGRFCSLVLAYNLPAQTSVTIRDSTITATGVVNYKQIDGLTNAITAPLVLYTTTLSHSQLRVHNSVLQTLTTGGVAVYVGGGMHLLSSAVVFHDVLLEASGGANVHAMYVPPSSPLTLEERSVFSVTNVSVESSGSGFTLGGGVAISDSVLRFVGVDGHVPASPVVTASGGTVGSDGWLDLHDVWVRSAASSVASLSSLALSGGTVSIARCTVAGTTLASGPALGSGVVSVQCNRVGDKVLKSSSDYTGAGLPYVTLAACDDCVERQKCFGSTTVLFSDCTCKCSADGAGEACLPFNVPLGKNVGMQDCMQGVVQTESKEIRVRGAEVCFEAVVFSGPITVTVSLRWMDTFAAALNVTLRNCLLVNGAILQIKGVDQVHAGALPPLHLSMTNVTSTEGTIVLHGALPSKSSVLLANSVLRATINGSHYVPTSSGEGANRYAPVLVLDGVRLRSTQFVVTRTTLLCNEAPCTPILVEHNLVVGQSSAFYMDNCVVKSPGRVMEFVLSNLNVEGGSVFSIQNSSWWAETAKGSVDAWRCDGITVTGKSVLQVAGNNFRLRNSMIDMNTLTLDESSWLVHRDNEFHGTHFLSLKSVKFGTGSVWSVLRNRFVVRPGLFSVAGDMWNIYDVDTDELSVHGMCNYRYGVLVTSYSSLAMQMNVTHHECGACDRSASCFAAMSRVKSGSACGCECSADGHSDACLPAPVPLALGPLPPLDPGVDAVPCVHGDTVDAVELPLLGVSGLCFVGVRFTSPITIDLSKFQPTRSTINITLLQCTLPGLQITGTSEYALYMNLAASTVDRGTVVFLGVFAPSSQIYMVDSVIDTTHSVGVYFDAEFGSNMTLLLLRSVMISTKRAIEFKNGFTLNASSFVVEGCRLESASPNSEDSASIRLHSFQFVGGSQMSVVHTKMVAGSGVLMSGSSVLGSSSVLAFLGNTFTSSENAQKTGFLHGSHKLNVSGGSKLRVMHNKIKGASVYLLKGTFTGNLVLSGNNTALVFAYNIMEGSAEAFVAGETTVEQPAELLAGCNTRNEEAVKYSGVFSGKVTQFACGECTKSARCYMPVSGLVEGSPCFCSRAEYAGCVSCTPFEMPDITLVPRLDVPPNNNPTCVVGQTLKNVSLDMQKTHHCYVGVTFSGVGAVLTFSLRQMPLRHPINITFSGCTFEDGAALHFVGGGHALESAGVQIRVSRTVLRSSVVSFSNAYPQGSDIAVTDVDVLQSSFALTPDFLSNRFAAVVLKDVLLSNSSLLLIRDVNARVVLGKYQSSGQSSVVYFSESLTLLGGSSLYVQGCTVAGYESLFHLDGRVLVSNRSVLALLNSMTLVQGSNILQSKEVIVEGFSVFRVSGNTGKARYGIYMFGNVTVRRSSWADFRDNDVDSGPLVYPVSKFRVNIDNSSGLTLTGRRKEAEGFRDELVGAVEAGYKFAVGCLTLKPAAAAVDQTEGVIPGLTAAKACGECTMVGDCFAPLTTAFSNCTCTCSDGGYGGACVPSRLELPQPRPPLPSPPASGECIRDMDYPEVVQTIGDGLSWLCYRNVTFSGPFMRLTVDVGAMTGDVVNITFDGCRWLRGAALVLLAGGASGPSGPVNITVTRNVFEDAVLSPTGAFPLRTNIIISENRFNVTRPVSLPSLAFNQASCILSDEITLSSYSTLSIVGNAFYMRGPDSVLVYIGKGGLAVLSHSLFAMTGNKLTVDGDARAALRVLGDDITMAVQVRNNSVLLVERGLVFGALEDFLHFSALEVEANSSVLVRQNAGLSATNVFHVENSVTLRDSWLLIHKNAAYNKTRAVCRIDSLKMWASHLVVSGNSISPVAEETTHEGIMSLGRYSTHSLDAASQLILACNILNEDVVTNYDNLPSTITPRILGCGAACHHAVSCFPVLTAAAAGDDCTCTCAEGGRGDMCLPVDLPIVSSGDLCVRGVNVSWGVFVGFGDSAVCYAGVNFTADVVMDVGLMSGGARSVTLTDCRMEGKVNLYVLGWTSDPPASQRVSVWISGLVSRSGGGMLLAGKYPPESRVTVVDSTLVARIAVAYRSKYGLSTSACLVLHDVSLTGSVLTVARTQVVALFSDARGVLVGGSGLTLASGGALYMDRLAVQTARGLCVSIEGDVSAVGGSVLAFVDSGFFLCRHAVSVSGAMEVSGSAVAFVRNDFASTQGYAVWLGAATNLAKGSMLMMKECTHDNDSREMLHAAGTVSASGSTLSFVRNHVLFSRMLSVTASLGTDAHMRVACNSVRRRVLTTAKEYADAGFGDVSVVEVAGCTACDKDMYCYPPGAASTSEEGDECRCACSSGYGDVCLPVAAPALPSAKRLGWILFVENETLHSEIVVPCGVSEVTLRNVVLDGVQTTIYVPWMASGSVHILVQNVSLRNGAMLYVAGGMGVRGKQRVELSVCSVDAFNGMIVLTGTFHAESVLTITDSQLITTAPTKSAYLPDLNAVPYASTLVLLNLRLVRSVLVVHNVAILMVVESGYAVVADGAVLELLGGGIALDAVLIGGRTALYVGAELRALDGAVLRVSESKIHATDGLMLAKRVTASASAVVVNSNTGVLSGGALLKLRGPTSFVSGSWVSVRDNSISGAILSLPHGSHSAALQHSTLTLYGNAGSGPALMDGILATESEGQKFVVGCLRHNGEALLPENYSPVGISGVTRAVGCNTCDVDVSCFSAATSSISACRCRCAEGGHGRDCLPVYLPHPEGCNRTLACPPLTVTTTTGRSVTQNNIRGGGVAPTRFVVTLPPPFRWASDPKLSAYLVFVLESFPQPRGFSGPWGEMLRNATWVRNTASPRVLELEVPEQSDYYIGVHEKISIQYTPHAVHGGCSGTVTVPLTIASKTPPGLTQALSIVTGVDASVTAVAVFVSGGFASLMEIEIFGVLAKMSCVSAQERMSLVVLPYFLSFFADLGFMWMVVGNALLIIVFGSVHYGLTLAFRRCRGVDALSAWAAMRFPSLTLLVAYMMHLGIFVCSVFMLAMHGAEAQHYVIGVIGVLYGVAFPFCVCIFLSHRTSMRFTEYHQFSEKPLHLRWLYPVGYWGPSEENMMYGSLLFGVRGDRVYWCVLQLCVLCLAGAIAAVQPPLENCHIQYFCMAAVLFAGANVVCFTNMMRSVFLTVMHTSTLALLAMLCLIDAVGYLSPSDEGVRAYAAIVILLLCVLLAIAVYIIVLWYVESRHWDIFREQKSLELAEHAGCSSANDHISKCGITEPVSEHHTTEVTH